MVQNIGQCLVKGKGVASFPLEPDRLGACKTNYTSLLFSSSLSIRGQSCSGFHTHSWICIPSYWQLGRAHLDYMTCRLSINPRVVSPAVDPGRPPFYQGPTMPATLSHSFGPIFPALDTYVEIGDSRRKVSRTLAPQIRAMPVALWYICSLPRTYLFSDPPPPISLMGGLGVLHHHKHSIPRLMSDPIPAIRLFVGGSHAPRGGLRFRCWRLSILSPVHCLYYRYARVSAK